MPDNLIRLTPEQVYAKLVNEDRITEVKGQIRFTLGNVGMIVKRKDVVGNILQEWLEEWLTANSVSFAPNPNTQMPPDIFLDIDDTTHDLLEVKAFNIEGSPGFDIADFKAFVKELLLKPYHLDTNFLIFGYTMDETSGDVTVERLWLKKIWEITKPMDNWPITLQYKNGRVQKMRPGNWFSTRARGKTFESLEDYLAAFEETVFQNPETRPQSAQWKNEFCKSYYEYYGISLDIPRWNDIKQKYE